ncbi:MAG TPA: ABC transporter ATP-binding protein [Streptosporangiaceae bacterium]|nr:ABC transporter ATP-binding protein [Streptosporangiaceae bacterium]
MGHVLEIENLSARIQLRRSVVQAVGNVGLYLDRGETLGLVGESGCGKSMTGLSVMGLLPAGGSIAEGSMKLDGRELVGLPESEYQRIRGNDIAMVFQDSMTALNPTKTIGFQVAEPVRVHRGASRKEALDRAVEILTMVGIPQPRERLDNYPHQLSGGLRQRVMIAIALACEPKVLIADEPTTALDVTTQAQILRLLGQLKDRLGMSMLLITHDMGVIAGWADRVNVMYAGHIVEATTADNLFGRMRHPYTQALLASIPVLEQDKSSHLFSIPGSPPDLTAPPAGCRFAARCSQVTDECRRAEPPLVSREPEHFFACWNPVDGPLTVAAPGSGKSAVTARPGRPAGADEPALSVTDLVKEFAVTSSTRSSRGTVKAVSGVSFSVSAGETFGLVGESGCGKTTIGRMIVALESPTNGSVHSEGTAASSLRGRALRRWRRDLQMVFQDPYDSLDPRLRVGALLREPLEIQGIGTRREQIARVRELLDEVGLPPSSEERYPHEFSGGQRQRIGLARALALNPRVIVADEPVSALDVSIRSQILNLMKRLQAAHDLSYVVISHDLTVVKYLADRIGVMYLGKLVETGSGDDIYQRAAHPYTAGLIAAIPKPDPGTAHRAGAVEISGELPSAMNPPSGCRFRTRCAFADERCAEEEPVLRMFGPGHAAACHHPLQSPSA